MSIKTGNLSINSENIFPIIKKWLYSDHDIFVREVISNACDAITKLHKLEIFGEYEWPEGRKDRIDVIVDPDEKTLIFSDNGLGMTADEVEEYITQIAFSGAASFLEKYKSQGGNDEIIGHFGLGFYSVFMVADEVEIDTLSYREGAESVHWYCDGSSEYQMEEGTRTEVGTTITLHLREECLEFANEYRVREILEKYCSFMPVEIYLSTKNAPQEYETIDEAELREEDVVVERIHQEERTEERDTPEGGKETVVVSPARDLVKINKRPVPVNDIHPLWAKHPNECTDEEYRSFYRKLFKDYREPLFWIHLNMDYPFNLKGILYFPKINTEYDSIEGTIKLYNNQVFIADNIKEVIPEFLMLLKGVIDCPDLPLNVSRSALQNDGFVKKIADYISRKISEKLTGMCKTEREEYEKYWDDISPFIKYGCLKDEKFSDRMLDSILYKDLDGKYFTLSEYLEKIGASVQPAEEASTDETGSGSPEEEQPLDLDEDAETEEENPEPEKTKIYYVTDETQQSQYIRMFRESGQSAVVFRHNIDSPFIVHVEQKNENVVFQRIDADVTGDLRSDMTEEDRQSAETTLTDMFRKAIGNDQLSVRVEPLKDDTVSAILTRSEEERRMQESMERMYSMYGMDPSMFAGSSTLVLNANHKLVKYLLGHADAEQNPLICCQLYDMARLANQPLKPEEMTEFLKRSNEIMMLLTR